MKRKNLLELELRIPTIDLVTTRTLLGGMMGYGIMLPEVEIIDTPFCPSELDDAPHREDWKHDFDLPYYYDPRDDRDDDRPPDTDQNEEQNQDQGHNENEGNPPPRVPDGFCTIGTIAAAIQLQDPGITAHGAIALATSALAGAGVDTVPGENGGIFVTAEQYTRALLSLGFSEVDTTGSFSEGHIADWFRMGGYGIGTLWGDDGGHDILLINYNPDTQEFFYYDSTTGVRDWISLDKFVTDGSLILFR